MSIHYNQQHEYDEIYAVLKACQSFYELPGNHPYGCPLKLSPRLEDGLSEMNNCNDANPQDSAMGSMREEQSFYRHAVSPSHSGELKEVKKCNGCDDGFRCSKARKILS